MNLFEAIAAIKKPLTRSEGCVLPMPKPKPVPVQKPKAHTSIYEIDPERNHFGFHIDKEAGREGAVKWLTAYDRQTLDERDLWGGKKVQAQNATAKRLWHDGESTAEAARQMRLSESWVEKRFAAFSSALSEEKGANR